MALFIAADGGGTKTELVLFDDSGCVLARRLTGGSNPIFMEPQTALANVTVPIGEMLTECGLKMTDIAKIALFIPGIKRLAEPLKKLYGCEVPELGGDELSALYGALGESAGVVVLSGTGSFAIGRGDDGELHSVGGWGALFGDKGSGYSIGLSCLGTVAWRYDGGLGDTMLSERVKQRFEINEIGQLRSLQKNATLFSRERIASLCRDVAECARGGDADALRIIDEAAQSLAQLAQLCATRLRLENDSYPCVLLGGVSNMQGLIENGFANGLGQLCHKLKVTDSRFRPIVGTMLHLLKTYSTVTPTTIHHLTQV